MNGPRHEKPCFLHICRNVGTDQRLCFRYRDDTIPLLPMSEISSLYQSPVAVQPDLCLYTYEPRHEKACLRGF